MTDPHDPAQGPGHPILPRIPSAAEPTERTGAARFRRAVSRYATGIALVTTVADGLDHAMTANSFTSVSLDPMLALVCVEHGTRFHPAVLHSGVWAVSFLPTDRADAARWFAKKGRPLVGQFEPFDTHRGTDGCVLLDDALAGLELRTTQVITAGDHDILIGAVTEIHDPPGVPDHGAGEPIVYYASEFRHLS
jgi:flavin reductase (DIM6/NTAB) family NADH-FMN oxidoreductase RutF